MEYSERLQNVSVLGAAGKMGSGILLLTAVEMADLSLKPENRGKPFVLNAIDVSPQAMLGLMGYMRTQVQKMAEKKVSQLRVVYAERADLIENSDVVNEYTSHVLSLVRIVTRLENAWDSYLIFEAIKEDPSVKVSVLSGIDKNNPNKPWYFTNTSSIPIAELDSSAGLEGRIIGFHFYNPPAVQKLVELIKSAKTLPELETFALQYAKNLKKTIVPSNDIAGFIGNGHFMRDLLYGIAQAEELAKSGSFAGAVYKVNKITQEYLVRPMGIFQLIDYVGLDVCQYIMSVMHARNPEETLHSPLLDSFIMMGVKGGQYPDGSQKDGFLRYEKGKVTGVFDPGTKAYIPLTELQASGDSELGPLPEGMPQWKHAVRAVDKDAVFKPWFENLKAGTTPGSIMAVNYARRSCEIGKQLVSSGVAVNEQDVNTVLLTGFFHAYGPINNYL